MYAPRKEDTLVTESSGEETTSDTGTTSSSAMLKESAPIRFPRPPNWNTRTGKSNAIKSKIVTKKLRKTLGAARQPPAAAHRSRELKKSKNPRRRRETAPGRSAGRREVPLWVEEPAGHEPPVKKRKKALKPTLLSTRPSQRRHPPPRDEYESSSSDEGGCWKGAARWANGPQPKEFPARIENTAKRQQWLAWRRQFEAHLKLKGFAPPEYLSTYLYTTIGPELRQVIDQEEMITRPITADEEFGDAYEKLMSRLDLHFHRLSVRGTDICILNTMKQEQSESVNDYHTRLMNQAEVCDLQRSDWTVRQVFIDGLSDTYVKNDAFTRNLSINEALTMASRREVQDREMKMRTTTTEEKYESAEIKPKEGEEVAMLHEKRTNWGGNRSRFGGDRSNGGRGLRGGQQGRYTNRFPHRVNREYEGSINSEERNSFGRRGVGPSRYAGSRDGRQSERCGGLCTRCGRSTCDGSQKSCPAMGRTCFVCREIGHFGAVCKQDQANATGMNIQNEQQPHDGKVKIQEGEVSQDTTWC